MSRFCPLCEQECGAFLPFGSSPRPDARCPYCGSLERHRLLWVFLTTRSAFFDGREKRILHVGPEPGLDRRLAATAGVRYVSGDLHDPTAMVRLDVTALPLPTDSVDVIYCSHVLEHVPNDRQALREFRRVLGVDGWAALIVPLEGSVTREDPTLAPEERACRFGDSDHVRLYGRDFAHRLREAGFQVRAIQGRDLLDPAEVVRLGLKDRLVFHCR